MRIEKIQDSYKQPSFNAGKVKVFSNFDKTFLPASHKQFLYNSDKELMQKVFDTFKNLKKFWHITMSELSFYDIVSYSSDTS